MLFKKYHIVIFRDGIGQCRKLRCSGWIIATLLFFVVALGAGNVYFWQYYQQFSTLERSLVESEKTVHEQKTQLVSLASKIKNIEKDLNRIRTFDSKLRVMINAEPGQPQNVSALGGPEGNTFSKNYLTLYRQELLARKMHNYLRQLSTEARLEEVKQQDLIQNIRQNREALASTPSIWPTEGWITSTFGYRTSPFTGKREFHKGLDISAPHGTPIYAPAKGKVSFTGRDGAYGLAMNLDHGSGISTKYAHLHRVAVKPGQTVSRGELIGYVGNTGRSTGPHLHYEVRLNGVPVNPMRYILN
ncbi:Peptidase M23 [Alkalidesulfovibrio alkalitolerans DSM 16529]|jgi:murein DD-endopeptidase MepM/ murein hydrolase activator NlpD|uniref:Peptidase M23 n=1 Tax=Alkalidesulfovibrio alkalitolerans DSM 16529 TaxID=1121439 RepID=S7TDJ0_9BACT|nr:M23 family metallopeptidase [Alkalidesulfovibrio alkalitolerans]EPR34650.1 Peptidase M23 [Alkalidesulfovibrio alkalitolerans DSM 16529]